MAGRTVVATGTLAADDQATVGVKVPGRLRSVSVDLGTQVSNGQVIAQVDPTDYQLAVEQAASALAQARVLVGLSPDGTDERVDIEGTGTVSTARATLEEARANRDRAITLVQQGVIARSEFDTSNATFLRAQSALQDAREQIRNRIGLVRQRRSELALARQRLADTVVRSPTNGVVQERQASVGEFLAASAPVATVVRMNPLRLRAEIPERDAPSVRAGQRVNVTVEGDAAVYRGSVVRLSPTIAEQNRILIVEAEITNPGNLRPGSFARAEIVVDDSAKASTVPPSAVVTFAGLEKVIVVEGGNAVEKVVTTGRRTDDWIEILSGLNVGESVVVEPGNLQQGQAVTVTQ